MGGGTLSSRRRENAALIQISKAPMSRLGNVYMSMTALEYSSIFYDFRGKNAIFPQRQLQQDYLESEICWTMGPSHACP